MNWEGSELNKAKEILAYELTKMVHGEEEANKALNAAKAVFGAGASSADMPTTAVSPDALDENKTVSVIDILLASGLAASRSEARRLIQQGGISVDDDKVTAFDAVIDEETLKKGIIIKKGKKIYHKITL